MMPVEKIAEDKQEIINMVIQMNNINFLKAIYWFVKRLAEHKGK